MPLQKQNITEHNRYNIDKKETKKGKKEKKKRKENEMKYGRATTDLYAKSNMHHQTNIAIQTNVCTSYSGTEAKAKIQLVALSFIGKIFSGGNNWWI